jgi:serine/threonine protein kinase/Tfp pilus assembly protein PilF
MISNPIWEEADAPGTKLVVRRFEATWRADPRRRPDPADFLPGDGTVDPASLLALLRADMVLHHEAGEPLRVEEYCDRFPDLPTAVVVALLYEEYCLREEMGESLTFAEYEHRFPAAASELREILEIHSLVRTGHRVSATMAPPASQFPSAGQTIAGYHLVEELGRGAFARVFLARERQLADRLVALKVARNGSREPQTLARLQHTHIVPVYSYRIDPATGLHLLCMPYLGRVTLAALLAHPRVRSARGGADLVAALDEMGATAETEANRQEGRRALARRGHARAIAWWGARLAEALQHAHDRGVLHRDIKPSNILITGDGLPMLLDFNLAQESWIADPFAAPTALGGTLAYMAPEHLEALADGAASRVDGRADVYSLGVVLFEALNHGERLFAVPLGATSIPELLRRAAEERRGHVPRLRAVRPDVPVELEAVVRRCMAPDRADRYATPSQLAADLQAVADDAPLHYASEPLPNRVGRWLRRHRRALALAAPPLLALAALAVITVDARLARLKLEAEVEREIREGEHSVAADQLDQAAGQFATAIRLTSDNPGLQSLGDQARMLHDRALSAKEVRDRADTFSRRAEPLRFGLLGFGGEPEAAVQGVEEVLRLFAIPDNPNWAERSELRLLDPPRRERLLAEADELLFLWIVALDRGRPPDPKRDRRAMRICDAARVFVTRAGPWPAVRARYAARLAGRPTLGPDEVPLLGATGLACFQWGLLRHLEGRPDAAISCLEHAVQLRPDAYWFQFYLGYRHERAGRIQKAIEHDNVAIALRPGVPWALYNRAQLRRQQGEWGQALADIERALVAAQSAGFEFIEARLESGIVREFLGDIAGARAEYERVIAAGAGRAYASAARLNLAKLDLNAGAADRARAALDALRSEGPGDPNERFGLAVLALRLGEYPWAEAELTRLLQDAIGDAAEIHAHRAVARLALGETSEARSDAEAALRLRPSPGHERLWFRALLADGKDRALPELLALDDPDDVERLHAVRTPLAIDLRAAATRLRALAEQGGILAAPARRTLAVLLVALRDPKANAEATRAVAEAPESADGYLVRARIRRRTGDPPGALADVGRGLALAPADPRFWELRGRLLAELGQPEAALTDLQRAGLRGTRGTIHAARARALMDLGRFEAARDAWSSALAFDSEDPRAYLGRARALVRLGRWDDASADLEQAVGWSSNRADVLARIALTYASCLPGRPDKLPRVVDLACQTLSAWVETSSRLRKEDQAKR